MKLSFAIISGLFPAYLSESYFDVGDFQRDTRRFINSLEKSIPAIEQHANFNSLSKTTSFTLNVSGALTCTAVAAGSVVAAPFGELMPREIPSVCYNLYFY